MYVMNEKNTKLFRESKLKVEYKVKRDDTNITTGRDRWVVSEYLNNVWNNSREFSSEEKAVERANYLNEFVVRNNIESSLMDIRR